MPKMRRLLPIVVTLMLLAGCGDGASISSLTSGNGDTPPTGTPTPSASPSPSPSTGDLPPGQEGDSPPPDATEGHQQSPPATANIVSACYLVTEADISRVVQGFVKITFTAKPREDRTVSALTGDTSTCHMPLQSQFSDASGISVIGGEVLVRIQKAGTDEFFPPRAGDTEITGLAAQAIARNGRVYVRLLGTWVLTVSAGTPNNAPDQLAKRIDWATQLAKTAVAKLR